MGKFDEMSFKGKCDCCGKETDIVVCASSLFPVSQGYCKECLNKRLEPFDDLALFVALSGGYPVRYFQRFKEKVTYILKELGRTEEEFNEEVDRQIENINKQFEKEYVCEWVGDDNE